MTKTIMSVSDIFIHFEVNIQIVKIFWLYYVMLLYYYKIL